MAVRKHNLVFDNPISVISAVVLLLATASIPAWSADKLQPLDVKLGLWEVTTTSSNAGEMPIPADVLAKLTPEQRARMEERIKASSAGQTKTAVHKDCLTREKLEKSLAFGDEGMKSCNHTIVSSSTNKLEVRLQCTEKEVKANFVLQLEALNSEHVKGSVHGTASGNDHTMNTDSAFTARWIGGACGDVH
jgi:hypothetical protein